MPPNEFLNPLLDEQETRKLRHPPLRPLNIPEGINLSLGKGFVEYDAYPNKERFEEIMQRVRMASR